jgi:hypothetical protein
MTYSSDMIRAATSIIAEMQGLDPKPNKRMQDSFRQTLETDWYLSAPEFDAPVYTSQLYLWELIICHRKYTSHYVRWLSGYFASTIRPKRIVDIHAGFGFAAAMMALYLPDTEVVAHVEPLLHRMIGAAVLEEVERPPNLRFVSAHGLAPDDTDLVTAFEVMEHVRDPIAYRRDVTERAQFYVDASSFSARATGHFPTYCDGDEIIESKKTMRRFNAALRADGFELVAQGWNTRPRIWRRR